jgi:hypothetical protein
MGKRKKNARRSVVKELSASVSYDDLPAASTMFIANTGM